jgi:ribosomal protein S18 acetylase RimI-like enzyme
VEIRRLTDADAGAYRQVRLRSLRDHPDIFGRAFEEAQDLAQMTEELRTDHDGTRSFILGAFDGELVGIVAVTRERGRKREHKALLWGMYVAPEARGRGVGRALVEAAIARARAWPGVVQIHLEVAVHNDAARALYDSLGFGVIGREPRGLRLPDRDVDEDYMVLLLDGGPGARR